MQNVTASNKCAAIKLQQATEKPKSFDVRVPKDFVFLLLDKMVNDLVIEPTASGDMPLLAHPDIDLSEVRKAIRARNLEQLLLATKPFDARSIASKWSSEPQIAFGLYQIHTLLKKFPLSGEQCREAAKASFHEYERHCDLFNRENYKAIVALNKRHPDYLGIIEEIRADIAACIGVQPSLSSVYDNARHGPGTALGLYAPMVTSYFKWTPPYSVSPKALPYVREAISADPRWIGALWDYFRTQFEIPMHAPVPEWLLWEWALKSYDYCQYSTVPKSAVTDRSIGIEPELNVYLQLGVDRVIRRRLKLRWGIDLNSQSENQLLALNASVTNEDATIDLKGASDCTAVMTAYMLLPEAWFALLMDLRSENILMDRPKVGNEGQPVTLAKISAMGNGFTFVLESLIFAAIARASMRRKKHKGKISVFGDDIIVPRTVAPFCIDLLKLFGYLVNEEKTFIEGPFRESCGVDCLNGINIRPLFLKRPVLQVTDLWYVTNSLYVLERRLPWHWEVSFQKTREWIYSLIPIGLRHIVGPPSQSLDTYLFKENVRYDKNGKHKHLAVVPLAPKFNNRAPAFFIRKLMVSLSAPEDDPTRQLSQFAHLPKIFGGAVDWQKGWKTGGSVCDNQKQSASAFDVTLRGVVELKLITREAWKL